MLQFLLKLVSKHTKKAFVTYLAWKRHIRRVNENMAWHSMHLIATFLGPVNESWHEESVLPVDRINLENILELIKRLLTFIKHFPLMFHQKAFGFNSVKNVQICTTALIAFKNGMANIFIPQCLSSLNKSCYLLMNDKISFESLLL